MRVGQGIRLLETQVQRPKLNCDPKDKAGGYQYASKQANGPRELTFKNLFPRCMIEVEAKHSTILVLSKGKIQGFSIFTGDTILTRK